MIICAVAVAPPGIFGGFPSVRSARATFLQKSEDWIGCYVSGLRSTVPKLFRQMLRKLLLVRFQSPALMFPVCLDDARVGDVKSS